MAKLCAVADPRIDYIASSRVGHNESAQKVAYEELLKETEEEIFQALIHGLGPKGMKDLGIGYQDSRKRIVS